MRIGIFGGTFDPVHSGHIALAKSAVKELHLHQLYFVPAKRTPLKSHSPLAAERKRLSRLKSAIKEIPSAKISLVELNRPAPSYSIDTIRYFSKKFPGDQLFLVMGSDSLANFERWKKWKDILNSCKLAVAVRAGIKIAKTAVRKNAEGKIVWLKSQMPAISSTQLRIEQKITAHLKKTLPSKRFQHVRCVMQLAEKLAQHYQLSIEKAKLSASLHDLARCWSEKKLIRYVQSRRLQIPGKEWSIQHQPVLLHSYVSADLSKRKFGVKDREILSAIEKHTLADFVMNPLDKLLFLSDLTAEDRDFPGVQKLRKLAFSSLDRAFLEGLRSKMEYLLHTKSCIHPKMIQVWNRFVEGSR